MVIVAPDGPVGYLTLLRRNRNFRCLWLSEIVSLFGDWFNLIASASLIGVLSGSGTAVSGLFAARMLAPFALSPIGGVLADRLNRKWIMFMTDVCRAVVVLGFLLVRRPEHVWLFYVLTAIQLGLSGLFFPARNAILPDIVSPGELGAANALSSATWAVMLAVGTALGGFLTGLWGIYPTFLVDVASFVFSAVWIARVTYRMADAIAPIDRALYTPWKQWLDGFRYLRRQIDVLFIALHKGANDLFIAGGLNVLLVVIARDHFPLGERGGISIGLLFTATGIGSGIGPLIVRRLTGDRDRSTRLALGLSYAVSAAGLAIIASMASFGVVMLGTVVRGIGGGMMWVFSSQLLMKHVPNDVRGRVFGVEFAFRTVMSAAGAALVGLGVDAVSGLSLLLWPVAGLALIPGLLWLLWLGASQPGPQASEVIEASMKKAQQ